MTQTIIEEKEGQIIIYSDIYDIKVDSNRFLYLKKHTEDNINFKKTELQVPLGLKKYEKEDYMLGVLRNVNNLHSFDESEIEESEDSSDSDDSILEVCGSD